MYTLVNRRDWTNKYLMQYGAHVAQSKDLRQRPGRRAYIRTKPKLDSKLKYDTELSRMILYNSSSSQTKRTHNSL